MFNPENQEACTYIKFCIYKEVNNTVNFDDYLISTVTNHVNIGYLKKRRNFDDYLILTATNYVNTGYLKKH